MSDTGVVRNLLVVFGVEVKNQFAAQKLEDGINAISEGMSRLNSMAQRAAAGIAAVSAGLVAATKPVADNASEIHKYSKAFGMTTTRMQELGFGIEALGAKRDDLSDVFLQISEKVRQAQQGSKEATKGFKDMGIGMEELKNKTPDQVFVRMIDGFRSIKDEQTKFALVSQLLGEDLGKKLLPIMTKGGVTLEQYAAIARDAGAIMSESQIETGRRVSETYRRLNMVLKALQIRIGIELMPHVDRIGRKMWTWYQANKEFVNSKIAEYVQKVGDGLEWVKNTSIQLGSLMDRMGGLEAIAKRVFVAMGLLAGLKLVSVLVSLGSGFVTVATALTSQVTLALLSVAAVVALVGGEIALLGEDFAVFERGGESWFGFLLENAKKLPKAFQVMLEILKALRAGFQNLLGYLGWVSEEFAVWEEILRPFVPWIINGLLLVGGIVVAYLLAPLLAIVGVITLIGKVLRVVGAFWLSGMKMAFAAFKAVVLDGPAALKEEMTKYGVSIIKDLLGVFSVAGDFGRALASEYLQLLSDQWTAIGEGIYTVFTRPMDIIDSIIEKVKTLLSIIQSVPEGIFEGGKRLGGALFEEADRFKFANFQRGRDALRRPADAPMVNRYQGENPNAAAAGSKTIQVTAGDTVIQVQGTGDPAAVASKVQRAQAMTWDKVLNSAATTAGGL